MQLDEQDDDVDALDGRVTTLEEDAVEKHMDIDDLETAVEGLTDMKAMLAMDIMDNTDLINALTMRVETNEGFIGEVQTLAGTNALAIEALQDDVE